MLVGTCRTNVGGVKHRMSLRVAVFCCQRHHTLPPISPVLSKMLVQHPTMAPSPWRSLRSIWSLLFICDLLPMCCLLMLAASCLFLEHKASYLSHWHLCFLCLRCHFPQITINQCPQLLQAVFQISLLNWRRLESHSQTCVDLCRINVIHHWDSFPTVPKKSSVRMALSSGSS